MIVAVPIPPPVHIVTHTDAFEPDTSPVATLDNVDGDGWVCVATIFNGGVTAISPDGSVVEHHATGDILTTNVCFGGNDLRTAYVTLSSTGRLVSFPWPRDGLRLAHL
jgi:sugar lactone lactonase YvrE